MRSREGVLSSSAHLPLHLGLLGEPHAPAIQWQGQPQRASTRPPKSPSVCRSLLVWGEVGVQRANENLQIPGSHLKCLEERALGSKANSDLD